MKSNTLLKIVQAVEVAISALKQPIKELLAVKTEAKLLAVAGVTIIEVALMQQLITRIK